MLCMCYVCQQGGVASPPAEGCWYQASPAKGQTDLTNWHLLMGVVVISRHVK